VSDTALNSMLITAFSTVIEEMLSEDDDVADLYRLD